MAERRVYIQSLDIDFGLLRLASFWTDLEKAIAGDTVVLDFTRCSEIHSVGMVMLAGALRVLSSRGVGGKVDKSTLSPHILSKLVNSGCGAHVGLCAVDTERRLFRHDLIDDSKSVIDFLEKEWLPRVGITMSDSLKKEVTGQVWEIYANAFEHGGSMVGVFTCGEQLSDGSMVLSVADFGIGIPSNAQRALGRKVGGADALRWAFEPGTTTLTGTQRYPRGLGLSLLKELAELNEGQLDLQSHSGHTRVTSREQSFHDIEVPVASTLVRLQLSANGLHYMFREELPDYMQQFGDPWRGP